MVTSPAVQLSLVSLPLVPNVHQIQISPAATVTFLYVRRDSCLRWSAWRRQR